MVLPSYQSDWAQPQEQGTGWWKSNFAAPFSYEQRPSSFGQAEYAPWAKGLAYAPTSSMTYRLMQERWDQWMQETYPELYQFDQPGGAFGTGEVGTVGRDPGFGQFSKTPEVYDEIQQAAIKYGVPANFLQAIIAKESSGDWASNARPVAVGSRGGKRIHGYVGVFEDAAASWGFDFNKGTGNRAYQIEMLAGGLRQWYDRLHAQNPQYGWLNVAAVHYSGDPTGQQTPGDSWQHGSTQKYMADVQAWWSRLDAMSGSNTQGFDPGPIVAGTALGSPTTPRWQAVNQWDQTVMQAATRYNVPPNLIKAIMMAESGGDPRARSPQGATGLMQIMPMHNGRQGLSINDPQQNIMLGALILQENYKQYGSWDMAAKAYLGLGGADALGTTSDTYWARVNQYWGELNAASSGMFGGPAQGGGAMSTLESIWGGGKREVTQGHGPTPYSLGEGRWQYEYSVGVLGTWGHPGIDVGMEVGTKLYSPVGGTVITTGGSGSYYNTAGTRNQSGLGELRIRLDNGHELILGHMSRIDIPLGARVTPGQYVGLSGYPSAPHVHIEYRMPDAGMGSGWRAVDPREVFGGTFAGSFTGATTPTPGINRPMTYLDLMRQAAMGKAILPGQAMSSGSGWHDWVRGAMFGQPRSWDLQRPTGAAYRPILPGSYVTPSPVAVGPTP